MQRQAVRRASEEWSYHDDDQHVKAESADFAVFFVLEQVNDSADEDRHGEVGQTATQQKEGSEHHEPTLFFSILHHKLERCLFLRLGPCRWLFVAGAFVFLRFSVDWRVRADQLGAFICFFLLNQRLGGGVCNRSSRHQCQN